MVHPAIKRSAHVSPATAYCVFVAENPEITNAAARLGAWMIGVGKMQGGFPLQLSIRAISHGWRRDGVRIEGTGSRRETIHQSIDFLVEHGVLEVTDDPEDLHSKLYSIIL